jgi:glucose/arabinose dehydrogenase
LSATPYVFDTAEQHRIKVTVVARGLEHPWALVVLPNGDMLVTERPGRLRLISNGALDPKPVAGVPAVRSAGLGGLEDIALHPRFAENHFIYLTYIKPVDAQRGTPALARGRLEHGALVDVKDLLVTDPGPVGSSAVNSRIAFGRDGMLYMSTGGNIANLAQDPASLRGKILRLRDDGSAPDDNPFIGRQGYRPEIFTLGHRNTLALIVHPTTGELWNNENGPNGGDEINVIKAGKNYGWPLVSFGRDYPGPRISEHPTREGFESPLVTWIPSVAASGMAIYTGEAFPKWRGNAFVGAMRVGEIEGTGHLQRIVFNAKMEEIRRETLLAELRQRIREVRQGPDGLLYLLTDMDDGALLRIEPAP